MCTCNVCTYHNEFKAELAKLPEENRPFFERLFDNYSMQGADLNHANAIIDGSWPSADEAIAGAREQRAEAKLARDAATSPTVATHGAGSTLPAGAHSPIAP